jgi:WD40 repeat protein
MQEYKLPDSKFLKRPIYLKRFINLINKTGSQLFFLILVYLVPISLCYNNLLLAESPRCSDLFISEDYLRTAVLALVRLEKSFSLDPQFQHDSSYRLSLLSKFNLELDKLLAIDREKTLTIYKEEKLHQVTTQVPSQNSKLQLETVKKNEIKFLTDIDKIIAEYTNILIPEVVVTPDFRILVAMPADGRIRVINLITHQIMYEISGSEAVISPDGNYLVVTPRNVNSTGEIDSKIKVLDLKSGELIYEIENRALVFKPSITSDGQFLIIAPQRGGFDVFDLKTGAVKYKKENSGVMAAVSIENNVLAVFRQDTEVLDLVDINTGLVVPAVPPPENHHSTPLTKKIVSFAKKLLQTETVPRAITRYLQRAEFSSDDRFLISHLSTQSKQYIKVSDILLKVDIADLELSASKLEFKVDSKNNRLFIFVDMKQLKVFELSSGRPIYEKEFDTDVTILSSIFNNNFLVISLRNNLDQKTTYSTDVFDVQTGAKLYTLTDTNQSAVLKMAISPDNQLLALGYANGVLQVFDMHQQVKYVDDETYTAVVSQIFFDPNSKFLFSSAGDGKIRVIKLEAFQKRQK